MRIDWHPEARKELESFDDTVEKRILKSVDELGDAPLGENTSLFRKQGLELFRYKLKNDKMDHRVFFDLEDGKILIYGVEHRDDAYTPESIQKIKSRT